jgi:hypothetical protein
MYLVFYSIQKAEDAITMINQNLGYPDGKGTDTWSLISKAYNQNIWFFPMPPKGMQEVVFDEQTSDISIYLPNNPIQV